ncbi:MAG: type II toxin-antitoxin system PemK/MazF family toxin [bacterium]|nr:type II toxin-antitoxin system PemK/MazF family toxin [bacterium]
MTKRTEMRFKAGRLILVAYPFTDHTAAKLRPALVVSGSTNGDFVAVPISSQVDTATGTFAYPILETEDYFQATKLRCSSTVRWSKPMTISGSVVQRRLGTVPTEVLGEIQRLIRGLFSSDT